MKIALLWVAVPVLSMATALGLMPQRQAGPSATVAYVSAQRIATETADGRTGNARIQTMQRDRAADVRAKQDAFEASRKQLAAAGPNDQARLEALVQDNRVELERAVARAQADLQALQRQVNADTLAKVRTVVADVVKGRDIQVVLNSEAAVIWAAPSLDLTDAVIAKMNAAPAAAPPKK